MFRPGRLACGVAVLAGLALTPIASAVAEEPPTLAVGPEAPGAQHPASGQSLFDELFATPTGHAVPYPFERLLEAIDSRLAPSRARTALIPLGRSLQRYAAHPDYFASPRLVVAVDAEGAPSASAPLLRDRLFLGYQPAAEAIEVISYNETAGRFEFQEVVDYGADRRPQVQHAAREICVPCHQGHGPIFSRPLWSETNGTAAVTAELAALGSRYHGAPVRQGVDELDAFDQATDRANRIAVVNRLWDEGCGAGEAGMACRAALLKAALHYRLVGARAEWQPAGADAQAASLQERLLRLWPAGLATPSPDLPNRDPLAELAAAGTLDTILEPQGDMDPRSLRPALLQWQPSEDDAATFAGAARLVADTFAATDILWLDRQLAAHGGAESRHGAPCRLQRLQRGGDRHELRADCTGDGVALSGFVTMSGERIDGGRIEALAIGGAAGVRRLSITGGSVTQHGAVETLRFVPQEDGAGLSARLLSGLRVTGIVLASGPSQASVEITVVDDLGGLDQAIANLGRSDALGPGPLRRRVILGSLGQALTM